jgi:hypothetical protein
VQLVLQRQQALSHAAEVLPAQLLRPQHETVSHYLLLFLSTMAP